MSQSSSSSSIRKRNASSQDLSSQDQKLADLSSYKSGLKDYRRSVSLVKAPLVTARVFSKAVLHWVLASLNYFYNHKPLFYSVSSVILGGLLAYSFEGAHREYLLSAEHLLTLCIWWIGLGILSSVGLGTGLHTFVLYLGPFIAKTTLAVTECNTLALATEGANAFQCPTNSQIAPEEVTFYGIWTKVALASFLWGTGTAIGELPPYFVSRAATLSGQKLADLEELDHTTSQEAAKHGLVEMIKLKIYWALQKFGFGAILFFASIPNPLFDLAGLTCGHFLIPFWTFFGATFIGKAMIKAQIQTCFVILAFSKDRLQQLIHIVESAVPRLHGVLTPFFEKQRAQFHSMQEHHSAGENGSWLGTAWNFFLAAMILWFVRSIIDSTVQEKLAEQDQRNIEQYVKSNNITIPSKESNTANSNKEHS
jgi:hypothetical protein